MNDRAGIGSIGLYTNLDRIARGLAGIGIGPADPIAPEQLFPLDQWHYHGTDAIRAAAESLGLGPESRVLEVGSGIGGPARYLAHTIGCHVTALELQPQVHAIAADLTRRCGLEGRVTHLCGDALSQPLPEAGFDAVVSWLAVLHIPDRPRLLARLARALRPAAAVPSRISPCPRPSPRRTCATCTTFAKSASASPSRASRITCVTWRPPGSRASRRPT